MTRSGASPSISTLVFVALLVSLSYTQATAQNVLAPPRGMVGQPVCGVPADEAVLLTQQLDNGSWRMWSPAAGSIQTHSTEADAIGLWEQQNPAFVCEVTIRVNFREFTGKFYRLNRKMQVYREASDGIYAGEEDPRELIVGVRTDGGDEASTDGGGYCGLPEDEMVIFVFDREQLLALHASIYGGLPGPERWGSCGPFTCPPFGAPDHLFFETAEEAYLAASWRSPIPPSPYCTFNYANVNGTLFPLSLYRLSEPIDEDRLPFVQEDNMISNPQDSFNQWNDVPFDIDYTLHPR